MTDLLSSIDPSLRGYLPSSYVGKDGALSVSKAQAETIALQVKEHVKDLPQAEKDTYLALLSTASFAPTGSTVTDVESSLNRLDLALERLNTEGSLLDLATDIGELSRLLIQQADSQRKSELNERLAAREDAKGELLNQAKSQRDAAEQTRSGAIANLVISVAGAAVTGGGSLKSAIGAGKALTRLKNLRELPDLPATPTRTEVRKFDRATTERNEEMKRIETAANKATTSSQIISSVGGLGQGGGSAANSFFQADSQVTQAEGAEAAAKAQEIASEGDMAKEIQSGLDELIRTLINALKEIENSEADSMQSLTRV